MYLNVRHRPLRSRLLFKPFSFLFHRGSAEEGRHEHGASTVPRTPSPDRRTPKRGTSVPIPPIPPAKNPRGELIFSSRVDKSFIESYERYRTGFERIKEESEQRALAQTWYGWRVWPWNWSWSRASSIPIPSTPPGAIGSPGGNLSHHHRRHSPSPSITSRGRLTDTEGSAGSTPSSSRRASPVPGSRGRPKFGTGGSSRSGTPPGGVPLRMVSDRARRESFTYPLSADQRGGD
jgi:hypothetical protein